MPVIVGVFVAAGVVLAPLFTVLGCRVLNGFVHGQAGIWDVVRRFVLALAPVGFAMWVAHLLYHLAVGWSTAFPVIERAITGSMGAYPAALVPTWLPPIQLLLLDAGLLLTLYVSWRIAKQYAGQAGKALALLTPWAGVSCGLFAAGVWILLQPMQMRGMLH
jgi:hypothetical protein